MRKFEIISDIQWEKDIEEEYMAQCGRENAVKPRRGTKHSAGYDFISPVEIVIPAHKMAKIPSGVKAAMNEDEILSIYPRSSIGFKTGIRLANTVGIVDSDYYNNSDNEGHIYFQLINLSPFNIILHKGDKIGQGIIHKYITTDDDSAKGTRKGGFGSTTE